MSGNEGAFGSVIFRGNDESVRCLIFSVIDGVTDLRLTVLGTRGSVPVDGKEYETYGGGTSCYLVEAGKVNLLLDAGTGIYKCPADLEGEVHLLLTHPHLDHLLGLTFCPLIVQMHRPIHIYGRTRDGMTVKDQIDRLFSVPLWPALVENYPADITFHDLPEDFCIGDVKVEMMEAVHPGGSTVFRISHGGRSVVYATDFEDVRDKGAELAAFSKDTDLLIYDGQYTESEYKTWEGYGHSTMQIGLRIMRESGAKRLLITHHDPRHKDAFLAEQDRLLQEACPDACFARPMQVFDLQE